MDVRLIRLIWPQECEKPQPARRSLGDQGAVSRSTIALLSNTEDVLMASRHQLGIRVSSRPHSPSKSPLPLAARARRRDSLPSPNGCTRHPANQARKKRRREPEIITAPHDYLSIADFTLARRMCSRSCSAAAQTKSLRQAHLSGHTVKMHLQHIMRKLQVQNRTEVVARLGYKSVKRQWA